MRTNTSSTALRRRARAGFSLIELMVSLAIGGIAIGSMYAVGSATTRNLRVQERVASTQGALRVAMERVKKDFQRAGFMSSPNGTLTGEFCATQPGAGTVAAVLNFVDDDIVAKAFAGPSNENIGSTFDAVTLMGNYATTGEYAGVTIGGGNAVITPNPNWQSFTRDFTDWASGNFIATAFSDAFPVGRMVRVHALDETHHFGVITGVATAPPAISISPPINPACTAAGGWVSPLSLIRYSVQAATGEEAPLTTATGPVAILRRTEMNGATPGMPLMNGAAPWDDRAVLDYVVGFNLLFRMGTGNTVTWLLPQDAPTRAAAATAVNANPERIRSVVIDLAVRTPEQDPHMMYDASSGDLLSFKALTTMAGAARVRRLRAEVLLPNVAARAFP